MTCVYNLVGLSLMKFRGDCTFWELQTTITMHPANSKDGLAG